MDINFGHVFVSFLVLIFSLTVHESGHAWAADRLGDPTARSLGRVSLNTVVHVDPLGTLLFPSVGMLTGTPIIGWAKPVPVTTWWSDQPGRDYLVAAAGLDRLRRNRFAPLYALLLTSAFGLIVGTPYYHPLLWLRP